MAERGLPAAQPGLSRRRLGASVWTLLLALLALGACSAPPSETLLQGATMGTSYSVKLVGMAPNQDPATLQAEIDRILEGVNAAMSTYREDSELSRLNRNSGTDWIPVSPPLLQVLAEALAVSRLSGGAFDVTVGPLVNLWGFGPDPGGDRIPETTEIESARARVGYQFLELRQQPPAVRKSRPDLYLDLSAIAKGYGVDAVAEYLDKQGFDNYMVEIGGEVWARGRNGRGVPWRIAIEKPAANDRAVQEIIELDGVGVATSGDYRNFFQLDEQTYSHSIDPKTGRPVPHNLASVTVLGPTVMEADALATALLVLGPERGLVLAAEQDLPALFIIREENGFQERATPRFDHYLAAKP